MEEIVDLKFGGRKTVYNVTHPKLIQTYYLGPNSKRTITPVFEKEEQYVEAIIKSDALKKIENSAKLSITDTPKKIDTSDLGAESEKVVTSAALNKKEQLDETTIKLNSLNELKNSTTFSITDTPKK